MFKKIIIFLALIISIYFLISFIYRFKGFYRNSKLTNKPRTVVSMTTLPHRINKIHEVIENINKWDNKPDLIYLHIPKFSKRENKEYDIPIGLEKFENLILNRIEEDYGPVTKLYPILKLETDPETVIICIDDDILYDNYMSTHLLKCSQLYPYSVICTSGWNYINFGLFVLPLICPIPYVIRKVDILQCYNGVLYKRKFFDTSFEKWINNKDLMCNCLTVDDILISKYIKSRNIDIINISYIRGNKDVEIENKKTLAFLNFFGNKWSKCINYKT